MSSVIVAGDTSGSVTLQAPAVAGTTVLTLPTTSGTVVVNNGAQTIEFADGSASAPSITNSGDTNTGMFFPAADTIAFTEGGTESMRIDSSGNLIVGGTGAYLSASGRGNITLNGTSSALYTFSVNSTGVGYVGAGSSFVELATTTATPILFTTNSAERMRLDSAGALGLGVTPSAWSTAYKAIQFGKTGVLWAAAAANDFYLGNNNYYDGANLRYISNGFASEYYQASGIHAWRTAASGTAGNVVTMIETMRLDASGNLGIGNTSPTSTVDILGLQTNSSATSASVPTGTIHISTNTGDEVNAYGASLVFSQKWFSGAGRVAVGQITGVKTAGTGNFGGGLAFWTSNGSSNNLLERMRVDSAGNLLLGKTISDVTSQTGIIIFGTAADNGSMTATYNTATAKNNYHLYNINATNNGYRFYVGVNGGINNFSANNTNLSDARVKKDIVNAGNYLDKICAIPVRTFLYKDQSDDDLNLGVIAQEVEAIAPELVSNNGFGDTPDDGIPLKTIYQTDLQYALMKSIQELKAIVDTQAEQIKALQGAK